MEYFGSRGSNIEILVCRSLALIRTRNVRTIGEQAVRCSIYYLLYVPRNSTQLISMSSLSPSAANGTSSNRLRKTYGPVSARARGSDVELEVPSIFEENALES